MLRRITLGALAFALLLAHATVAVAQPAVRPTTIGGCTVTTSSATCIAAHTYTANITIENTSQSAIVACAWNATAILYDVGSFMIYPGGAKSWNTQTGTAPPTGPLNCIGSASATLHVEYY